MASDIHLAPSREQRRDLSVEPTHGATSSASQALCVFQRMGDVPKRWLPRLRRLTLGSFEGAMVRWSYHDGSTWAMVMFEGRRREPRAIVGWSVFTLQEAMHPVIGVFVDEAKRGRGYATTLVRGILTECRALIPYGSVYAVAEWWPKYVPLLQSMDLEHLEWD